MTHFRNWFEAALVAAFLFVASVVSAALEGPDEVQAEADARAAYMDSIQAAADMSEGERIARKVCGNWHGERAQVLQLESGEFVCRRRGEVL